MDYKLSPSDLTFLYDSCKNCFALKVKHGISQPSIPLPGIFSIIAGLQKNYYSGMRTEAFCPQLPPGIVTLGEKRVRSSSVSFQGIDSTCHIAGRFDIIIEFDDRTYGVIDFKTGNPSDDKTGMYARQLHAYALALENPAEGALMINPISQLGLLFFTPDMCKYEGNSRQMMSGQMTWIEIKRDDEGFVQFLKDVVFLLDGDIPRPQPETCDWCRYRSRIGGISRSGEEEGPDEQIAVQSPKCPQCSGPMRLRTGQFGDFWGCLSYPNCRGTRPA